MDRLKRLPGWRSRLHTCLETIRRRPFDWGVHDCALGLAVPCVEAITGVDLGAAWRGRYSDAAEARATLAVAGHADIGGLLASMFEEIAPSFATTGDLVTLPGEEDGLSMGVVTGSSIAALGRLGIVNVPFLSALRAFRV